jgi:hypothetical protein
LRYVSCHARPMTRRKTHDCPGPVAAPTVASAQHAAPPESAWSLLGPPCHWAAGVRRRCPRHLDPHDLRRTPLRARTEGGDAARRVPRPIRPSTLPGRASVLASTSGSLGAHMAILDHSLGWCAQRQGDGLLQRERLAGHERRRPRPSPRAAPAEATAASMSAAVGTSIGRRMPIRSRYAAAAPSRRAARSACPWLAPMMAQTPRLSPWTRIEPCPHSIILERRRRPRMGRMVGRVRQSRGRPRPPCHPLAGRPPYGAR